MEIFDKRAAKVATNLHAREKKRSQGQTVALQAGTPSQPDLAAQVARLQKENRTLVSLACPSYIMVVLRVSTLTLILQHCSPMSLHLTLI